MKSKCKTCGKNCEGEFCFLHKPRKKLAQTKTLSSVAKTVETIQEMRELFLIIWKKRLHLSEVSGLRLVGDPLHVYFHHILPKEKYPEAKFDEENIILLTLDEHTNVENNMYRYEEINIRREQLKLKYERSK